MTKRHPLLALRQAQYRLKEGKEGRSNIPNSTLLFPSLCFDPPKAYSAQVQEKGWDEFRIKTPHCLSPY